MVVVMQHWFGQLTEIRIVNWYRVARWFAVSHDSPVDAQLGAYPRVAQDDSTCTPMAEVGAESESIRELLDTGSSNCASTHPTLP